MEFDCTRRPVLGTPALAAEASGRKHSKHRKSAIPLSASVRLGSVPIAGLDFNDILTEADVCTRLSAPVESSTGWRRAM
jgi:hypothetical protein